MCYWVISLKAANKYKRIPKSIFINPCVEFVLLWGYIPYFSQLFSFLVFLKNSWKEFPRWGSAFPPYHMGTCIVFPSSGWKEKAPGGPGSRLWQSAPKGEDAGQQQHGGCRGNPGKKVSCGSNQAFLDAWGSLELVNYSSVREGRKNDGGGGREGQQLLPSWLDDVWESPQGKLLPGVNREGVGVWSNHRLGTPACSKESFYK